MWIEEGLRLNNLIPADDIRNLSGQIETPRITARDDFKVKKYCLLAALLFSIGQLFADESVDTIAPPPINFKQEFVHVDGHVYEVKFENNRLSIEEDPPWYREAMHNYIKRMYHKKEALNVPERFRPFIKERFDLVGFTKVFFEVVFKILFYGFALFSSAYVSWLCFKFVLRLFS